MFLISAQISIIFFRIFKKFLLNNKIFQTELQIVSL